MTFIKIFHKVIFYYNRKRICYFFILSIFVFFILCFIYSQISLRSDCVFILTKDISYGETITDDMISPVYIKNYHDSFVLDINSDKAKYNLKKGQILTKEVVVAENTSVQQVKITIPIHINDYLKKRDMINVYITTQTKNIENLLTNEFSFITTKLKEEDMTTIKLIESTEILDMYIVDDKEAYIVIATNEKIALIIENIKRISKFDFTILK